VSFLAGGEEIRNDGVQAPAPTFYHARHTFAMTVTLNNGVPIGA
jgi:hypothetical protein